MSAEKYSSGAVVEVFFLARQEVRGEKLARLEASGVLSSCILDLRDTCRGISGCVWACGAAIWAASLQGTRAAPGGKGTSRGGGARQRSGRGCVRGCVRGYARGYVCVLDIFVRGYVRGRVCAFGRGYVRG